MKYNSTGEQQWAQHYSGKSNIVSQPRNIGTDIEGNVYVSAYDQGTILIKYNTNGLLQWSRRLDESYNVVYDMVIDKSGCPASCWDRWFF